MKVQEKRTVEKQNSSMPYSSKIAASLFTVLFLFYFTIFLTLYLFYFMSFFLSLFYYISLSILSLFYRISFYEYLYS